MAAKGLEFSSAAVQIVSRERMVKIMSMKLKLALFIGLGAAFFGGVCLLRTGDGTADAEGRPVASSGGEGTSASACVVPLPGPSGSKVKKTLEVPLRNARVLGRHPKPELDLDDDDDDKRSPAERALASRIEKALDDEDLDLALACAKDALNCGNVEIRQAMVDTLGWFGVKALPELTPFLADADEDVRDSAMNEWSMAVSDIEDDGEKIGTVELAMQVLSDEDSLEDISGEYIGVDEKLAVESLLRIIEGGGTEKGISKAKETYEFVTGEEFTNRADAEKWLAEEYQPPTEND